jgi:hypothetical protein
MSERFLQSEMVQLGSQLSLVLQNNLYQDNNCLCLPPSKKSVLTISSPNFNIRYRNAKTWILHTNHYLAAKDGHLFFWRIPLYATLFLTKTMQKTYETSADTLFLGAFCRLFPLPI